MLGEVVSGTHLTRWCKQWLNSESNAAAVVSISRSNLLAQSVAPLLVLRQIAAGNNVADSWVSTHRVHSLVRTYVHVRTNTPLRRYALQHRHLIQTYEYIHTAQLYIHTGIHIATHIYFWLAQIGVYSSTMEVVLQDD